MGASANTGVAFLVAPASNPVSKLKKHCRWLNHLLTTLQPKLAPKEGTMSGEAHSQGAFKQ
eukprot:1556594-Amphidinium_carterae.1